MMPVRRLIASACLIAALPAVAEKKPPAAEAATKYPAVDNHAGEKVAIAVDVCDKKAKCPFFRIDYWENEFLPIRVIVTNDSDNIVSLDEARMQLMPEGGDKIPAAIEEEVNRRLFTIKNARGTKIPLGPLPPITIHHPVDKKITADFDDFGFETTIVKPHTTVAGYLFYDIRGVDNPIDASELYIRQVKTRMPGETSNQELFAFQIELKRSYRSLDTQKP